MAGSIGDKETSGRRREPRRPYGFACRQQSRPRERAIGEQVSDVAPDDKQLGGQRRTIGENEKIAEGGIACLITVGS